MVLNLIKATKKDAEIIWKMQRESFSDLFQKYCDEKTSPANEKIDKTIQRLEQPETTFYMLQYSGHFVGAVRVVDVVGNGMRRISPIFVLPKYRNKGIAQMAIREVERIHGAKGWILETILEESVSCHLYEKMGYRQTDTRRIINDKMTLVTYEK